MKSECVALLLVLALCGGVLHATIYVDDNAPGDPKPRDSQCQRPPGRRLHRAPVRQHPGGDRRGGGRRHHHRGPGTLPLARARGPTTRLKFKGKSIRLVSSAPTDFSVIDADHPVRRGHLRRHRRPQLPPPGVQDPELRLRRHPRQQHPGHHQPLHHQRQRSLRRDGRQGRVGANRQLPDRGQHDLPRLRRAAGRVRMSRHSSTAPSPTTCRAWTSPTPIFLRVVSSRSATASSMAIRSPCNLWRIHPCRHKWNTVC